MRIKMATNDMNKNGLLIIPMNDFWVDCYTTAIYSVLLSFCKVKKAIIYRNSYEYMFDYNKKNMGRVYIKTDIEDYINGLLILNTKHVFSKDKNIITSLKRFLDQNQLVMLGIDMEHKFVVIKPLNKEQDQRGDIPSNHKYKITIRSSYGRISNKDFMKKIEKVGDFS